VYSQRPGKHYRLGKGFEPRMWFPDTGSAAVVTRRRFKSREISNYDVNT